MHVVKLFHFLFLLFSFRLHVILLLLLAHQL